MKRDELIRDWTTEIRIAMGNEASPVLCRNAAERIARRLDALSLVVVSDVQISRIIKFVADEAWSVAADWGAPGGVCLAIEDLSDDPETRARLVVEVKAMLTPDGPRASCYDCGLSYHDPGFADLVVPHEIWRKISPTGHEGGLLCPTCMVRAAARAGVECAAVFRSGPFAMLTASETMGDPASPG